MSRFTEFFGFLSVLLVFQQPALAQQTEAISFAADVRPILAANCFGCHQGAIDRGGYVMTQFETMIQGGESGDAAIVPGKPD